MPRKPPNFRQTDLQRAVRSLREEGVAVERVEIGKTGGFILHTSKLKIDNVEDAARQQWTRATEELKTKPKPKAGKSKR
jgi:transcription initiation factor IIE alpha subunit